MKISKLCQNLYFGIELEQTKKYEKIAFLFFFIFVVLVSFFHEPWYDEFQAWGISKDSLYNILFVIPHYECHPPLWHLIIKCFSVFNINPELCLKIPNIAFIALGTWFLIFKSPFPRTVRILLPFTYFIFYQYGVICRPYSLFFAALMLCAGFFDKRKEHPFRYICLLAFLSLSSVFGLAITAGITIAWGLELIDLKNFKKSFLSLFKSKQFFAMILLFIFCLLTTIEIFPNQNNTAISLIKFLPMWQKCTFCFFESISDSTIFDLIIDQVFTANLFKNSLTTFHLIFATFFGIFLVIFLIKILMKTNTLMHFVIPYFLLCCLFLVYYSRHHVGLIFFIIIFCLWICYDKLLLNLTKTEFRILKILTILTISVQLYWSVSSSIGDICYNYETSREIANYIKKHELYNYKIFAGEWGTHFYVDKNGVPTFNPYIIATIDKTQDKNYTKKPLNLHDMYLAVFIIPYFNQNIFYNFNSDFPEKFYSLHRKKSDSETKEIINKWKEKGLPDVIIGSVRLDGIWQDKSLMKDFILVKNFKYYSIWKSRTINNETPIPLYLNKKLYNKLNFSQHIEQQ